MTLQTYLNDPVLKTAFLAEISKHEQQDAFIKGTYAQMNGHFKGCAIGCSLHSLNVLQGKKGKASAEHTGDHARYETELGIPIWLAYLEDHLFETLTDEESKTWPRTFAEAIPVGVTIPDRLLGKILVWTLTAETYGVRYATDREDLRGWIDAVAIFIDADSKGEATADQREAAARAAWAARDGRAAWAAWDAWAAWVARVARDGNYTAAKAAAFSTAAAAFSTALSRYVTEELRALGTEMQA